ncbi:MAG: class I SAM-dependent RNA methyltransferase [Deferrisomatales bacterium]
MRTGAPAKHPPPRVATLKVVAVADQGMAIGHLDGKVAFVPFAAPGDRVEVEVLREKRRHLETRLLRVLEPSPLRRTPPCPHFGVCGGCQWQHLPYPEQLAAKDQSFRGFLRSRVGLPDGVFRPPIASPAEWGYRNRVGLKVRRLAGEVGVGFFARGSHRLVPVERCPIAHPALQALLPALRAFLRGFGPAQGFVPQVDLQLDGWARPWAVVHRLRPLTPAETAELEAFLAGVGAGGGHLQAGRKDTLSPLAGAEGTMPFRILAGGRALELRVSAGGFVQANDAVNQALVDEVVELAPLYRGGLALDLYCGAGNFTLPLGLEAAAVVGVEGYPPAARDAQANAARHGLDRIRVLGEPAAAGLRALRAEGLRPAFALLDPPREGAAEALPLLAELGPRHLLYVSCSPPTLARDLRTLAELGYGVRWTRGADMFPQTAHLESITLLEREPRPGA